MKEKLKSLFRKGFKTSKFKSTVKLAISRLAVLKNQRQARCSIARSDVVEFLNIGNNERALLRVEQVIKEQNALDVYGVLEGYCNLLIDRVNLIEQEKVCPEELKEAVSSLIYAATRCGEFPELQEIRAIFTSRFGKEFAACSVELRNNCGVNLKVIQKLSTRMSTLENKMKVLREIASDNNIVLQIEENDSEITVEDQDSGKENQQKPIPSAPTGVSNPGEYKPKQPQDAERGEDFSGSVNMRRKYRDVTDAAQAAFESAAYAAAAARAAVELSRSESTDPDDPSSPNLGSRKASATFEHVKSKFQTREWKDLLEAEPTKVEMKFQKIHPIHSIGMEKFKQDENETKFKRSLSDSSLDSVDGNVNKMKMSSDEEGQIMPPARQRFFDGSDGEDQQKSRIPWTRNYDLDADEKNDIVEESSRKTHYSALKHFPLRSQVGLEMEAGPGNSPARFATENRTRSTEPLNINRRPISVRSRWKHGR